MPDSQPTVDGVIAKQSAKPAVSQPTAAAPATSAVKKWKLVLIVLIAFVYLSYILWCLLLMSMLPSPEAGSGMLVMGGVASVVIALLVLIAIDTLVYLHISRSKAAPSTRQMALIKLIGISAPALIISILTPWLITREPSLSVDIIAPTTDSEMVAPVSMTFSVQKAAQIAEARGVKPIQYKWDINNDKQVDQETLEPTLTATFEREGIYTVSVTMQGSGGSRTASRRFVIRQAVFSVQPPQPIIDRPAAFDLQHLFGSEEEISSVSWDFDGDGVEDENTDSLQATYTYLRTGRFTVSATVQLANQTQKRYERVVDVRDPMPLPFPVTITTQPTQLIGVAPFALLMHAETSEPTAYIQWNFGDGTKADGERVTHTYSKKGNYVVETSVRSQSGVIANLSTLVRVVSELKLPDLRFEGTPSVQSNRIEGEVPLTLNIKPVTSASFIQFSWEAPDATEVGATEGQLQAVYRRPGIYTVTLVAQDMEDHVLRLPITVEVKPPETLISISMEPETGVAPLSVRFDASESSIPNEDITGFVWTFGDNTPQEFGGAITEHTYRVPGTYEVQVAARTTSGNEKRTTRTIVVRAPSLQARILASRLSGQVPLAVEFDGGPSAGNIMRYQWDFGDQSENDGKTVTHVYTTAGVYTARLTVTDVSGSTATTTVSITVQ